MCSCTEMCACLVLFKQKARLAGAAASAGSSVSVAAHARGAAGAPSRMGPEECPSPARVAAGGAWPSCPHLADPGAQEGWGGGVKGGDPKAPAARPLRPVTC